MVHSELTSNKLSGLKNRKRNPYSLSAFLIRRKRKIEWEKLYKKFKFQPVLMCNVQFPGGNINITEDEVH